MTIQEALEFEKRLTIEIVARQKVEIELAYKDTLLAQWEEITTSGCSLIAKERALQISVEGWTSQHDDLHKRGEMADAASCYAKIAAMNSYIAPVPLDKPINWPWDEEWWKPSSDPIRNLEKAGALIAAEIDRLQRLELEKEGSK